MSETIEVGLF